MSLFCKIVQSLFKNIEINSEIPPSQAFSFLKTLPLSRKIRILFVKYHRGADRTPGRIPAGRIINTPVVAGPVLKVRYSTVQYCKLR